MKPLLVILGPTASGKTGLSLKWALEQNGEIISADATQVYRGIDIASAKASPEERALVPHHLIDIREPDEPYALSDFKHDATAAIADIESRGKLPIICGGTHLYIRAVTENYDLQPAPPLPEKRAEWEAIAREQSPEALHEILAQKDPATAARIHPNNIRYVVRALEIFESTGKPIQAGLKPPTHDVQKFAVEWPRDELYDRINHRIDLQIEGGLVEEVRKLHEAGYAEHLPAMRALGVKEILPYLKGEASLETCLEILKQSTRNFAKRQLTWLRKESDIIWIPHEQIV